MIEMNPRLTAIAGRLKGSIFTIEDLPVVIGRDTTATLCIADASVSRRHSQIEKEEEDFVILDLESLNGTFINDVPVKRRKLQHGDRVRIGDSQFIFLRHDGDLNSKSSEVRFDDGQIVSGSTLQVRFNDALYLMARDLSALMKVSTTINAIRGVEELQKTLLELLFEVVPAERGAILLIDPSPQGEEKEFASVFGLDRRRGQDESISVSRTVTKWVLHHGESLLISNQTDPKGFEASDSLLEQRPGSVLCVPLVMLGRTLGVIYLDTKEPDTLFDKDHLQLVSAISAITAVAIENARHIEWLVSENQRLIADFNIEHNMVGESPRIRDVLQFIAKVAPTDSTVLLSGESGTGKELAARAIHLNSLRASKPFMAVNCAALAESLLESELFGHEKGSFTGALMQKKGRLEIADGGTLFLDEIGELSPALQVKLLRVLQEREFERVGGTRTIKVDIRLITATNKKLEEAVEDGTFRQDLYYRLNVVNLEMPPLRDRQEDIPLLANYFAAKYSEKCNRRISGISPDAQARLLNYDWPGNVRELENAIERAVVIAPGDEITRECLRPEIADPQAARAVVREGSGASSAIDVGRGVNFYDEVRRFEIDLIRRALDQTGGHQSRAARLLGMNPTTLNSKIKTYNINLRP